MIMQKSDMEIIEFDAADVITTSGKGESVIKNIWLSTNSVNKFNQIAGDEGLPLLLLISSTNTYHPYTGAILPVPGYEGFIDGLGNNEKSTENEDGYRIVTDKTSYKEVLDWLLAHSNTN